MLVSLVRSRVVLDTASACKTQNPSRPPPYFIRHSQRCVLSNRLFTPSTMTKRRVLTIVLVVIIVTCTTNVTKLLWSYNNNDGNDDVLLPYHQQEMRPDNDNNNYPNHGIATATATLPLPLQYYTTADQRPTTTTNTNHTTNHITNSTSNSTSTTAALRCLQERGTHGHWVQDWDYAKTAQYKTFGRYPYEQLANHYFQASPSQPFRDATSWKWQDTNNCPTTLISIHGICKTVHDLGVTRIYTIGDSLSQGFSRTLRALVGFPEEAANFPCRQVLTIPCPAPYPAIQEWQSRWDGNVTTLETVVDRNFIQDNDDRNLLIFNIGVHIHSMDEYKHNFQGLLTWIDTLQQTRRNDLVSFRNTSPGHANCTPLEQPRSVNWTIPFNVTPFENYADWKKTETTLFDWHLMEAFNEYSKPLIDERPYIHWFNIFNSTVLRRDGHVGGTDCLHYSYPGPISWWVHLWYSMLLDLVELRVKT